MADDIEPLNTVPAAFADIAAKLNEIVAYVNAMKNARAGGGLDYKWTGGAGGPAKLVPLHSIDITKLISALDAAGYSRAVAAAAVNISGGGGGGGGGGDGSATELHYLDSSTRIDIDGAGIVIKNLSTGKEVYINPTLITQDVGIKTWAVCNSGTPASALVMASAPF